MKALFLLLTLVFLPACKEKKEINQTDMDNINVDGSSNYNRLFREEINKEKKEKRKAEDDYFKK